MQCLEVAEHVPKDKSGALIDNLTRHGSCVMFSAAVPGQGGEQHINEQPHEFWRDLFAMRGYRLFDCLRPSLAGLTEVESWYRYNLMLYVKDEALCTLPEAVLATRVPCGSRVDDRSPLTYRLRKMVLRQLSVDWVSRLAVWKHRRAVRSRRAN